MTRSLEDKILSRLLRVGDKERVSTMARRLRVSRDLIEETVSSMEECDVLVGYMGGDLPRSEWVVERYQ